jgi:bifunctional non-homologous end joining protein LigD
MPANKATKFRRTVSRCDRSGLFPGYHPSMIPDLNLIHGSATNRRRDLTLPAGFISPCLPMMAPRPPSGPSWLHEIKYDGVRVVARKVGGRVRLYDRLGADVTQRFPLIVDALAPLPSCTIDGEAVAGDDGRVPSFDLPQRQRDDRAVLCAFDLIELSGDDRRREPLAQRKADLSRLLAAASPGLVLCKWIDGDKCEGAVAFEQVCAMGLEGMVSKRKDSRYISGRSPYWLKMTNPGSDAARRRAQEESVRRTLPSVESPSTTALPDSHD